MGCGGIQPRETDFVGRAWCGRGLRDRHPSTTRPTARSLRAWRKGTRKTRRSVNAVSIAQSENVFGAPGRPDGDGRHASVASAESHSVTSPRWTKACSYADQFPTRYFVSCTSDGPLISCRDRAPAAFTVAREPTAASSQPKGCAPTPTTKAAARDAVYTNRRRIRGALGRALQRRRSERLERPNAQLYDTGGMRRTHLRGAREYPETVCASTSAGSTWAPSCAPCVTVGRHAQQPAGTLDDGLGPRCCGVGARPRPLAPTSVRMRPMTRPRPLRIIGLSSFPSRQCIRRGRLNHGLLVSCP